MGEGWQEEEEQPQVGKDKREDVEQTQADHRVKAREIADWEVCQAETSEEAGPYPQVAWERVE